MNSIHQRAGQKASQDELVDLKQLKSCYFRAVDADDEAQRVSFGTSGHRGSSFKNTFNQLHIQTITKAVVEYRKSQGINGPLFLGMDTHYLSELAFVTCLSILVEEGVDVRVQTGGGYTPTPVISRMIIEFNQNNSEQADGIIITPSHNPPQDGGIKYNEPHGGPASSEVTGEIQRLANDMIASRTQFPNDSELEVLYKHHKVIKQDFVNDYVKSLDLVINMAAIKASKVNIGIDPLGGAGLDCWQAIIEHWGLNATIVNDQLDPQFAFMNLDHDGKIRMDCSSEYAMQGLLAHKQDYDLCVANDADFDRHGIVTPQGLMKPNHYLAVAINFLFRHRTRWSKTLKVGKTLVSSSMIDRVVGNLELNLHEVPVGFKWFVEGLFNGELAFGGEESAGASFLTQDGKVWTTDKDGIILTLLAAEMIAVTGKNPAELYHELTTKFGEPCYSRIDVPTTSAIKNMLKNLDKGSVKIDVIAGDAIEDILTHAKGNGAKIGGLKVITKNGWFAARPSGTEDIYKIYAESFIGKEHLSQILEDAQDLIAQCIDN